MQLSLATHLPPCLSGKTNSIDWPQVPLTDCYKWHSRSKNQINIVFFSLQIQLEKATQGVILHVLVMATIRAETLNKHQSCHQHQASSQWGPLTGLKLIAHRAASEAEGSFSSGIITAPPVLASMTANCTSQCTHTHTHTAAPGKFDAGMTRLFPIVQLTNSPFLSQIPCWCK